MYNMQLWLFYMTPYIKILWSEMLMFTVIYAKPMAMAAGGSSFRPNSEQVVLGLNPNYV